MESISIFSKISNEDLDSTQLKDMKNTLDQLGTSLKRYNIKNVVEPAIETPICNFSLARGWMSNGIWNISCIEHFQSKFTLCIYIHTHTHIGRLFEFLIVNINHKALMIKIL